MDTNPRIVLVDDDPSVIATLTTFLELSGFRVESAQNGEEALTPIPLISSS